MLLFKFRSLHIKLSLFRILWDFCCEMFQGKIPHVEMWGSFGGWWAMLSLFVMRKGKLRNNGMRWHHSYSKCHLRCTVMECQLKHYIWGSRSSSESVHQDGCNDNFEKCIWGGLFLSTSHCLGTRELPWEP